MVTSLVQLKDIRIDRAARRLSLVDLYTFLRESDASSVGSHLRKLKLVKGPSCSSLIYASEHGFAFLKHDNRRGQASPAVGYNSQLRLCILDIWNTLLQSNKQCTTKILEVFCRQYLILQSQFQTIFGIVWEDEVSDWPDLTTTPLPTTNAQRVHPYTLASSSSSTVDPSAAADPSAADPSRSSAADTVPTTPRDLHPTSTGGPSSPANIDMITTEASKKRIVDLQAQSPGTNASNISSSPDTSSISDHGGMTSDSLKATKKYSELGSQYLEKFGSKPASHNLTALKHQLSKPETTPLVLELGKYMHQVQQACSMVLTAEAQPIAKSGYNIKIMCAPERVLHLVDSIGVHTDSQYSLRHSRTTKTGGTYMEWHCKFAKSFGTTKKGKSSTVHSTSSDVSTNPSFSVVGNQEDFKHSTATTTLDPSSSNTTGSVVPQSANCSPEHLDPASAPEGHDGLPAASTINLRSRTPKPQPKVYTCTPLLSLHQLICISYMCLS